MRDDDDECLVSRDVDEAIGYSAEVMCDVCDIEMDERATFVAKGGCDCLFDPAQVKAGAHLTL